MCSKLLRLAGAVAAAIPLAILLPSSGCAAPVANPLQRAAPPAVQAQGRVLLGLARAGDRLVAVGERGLVLLSDDHGRSWRQARVPVAVTLTAASFPTPQSGWATGHAGTVLHTEDGGETWVRQLDGNAVGRLLAAAPGQAALAQQFIADGPDKPFLDVVFQDPRNGIVAGAYGLILRTGDGGKTWAPLMDRVDNPKGLHIYAIRARGDGIWLAGEQGLLAHSADGGKTFGKVAAPYRGTYFTLGGLPDGGIVLGGLKGNAFRSNSGGFERLDGYPPLSLSASAVLADGRIAFANQAGQLFIAGPQGQDARMVPQLHPAPLAALAQAANGDLIVAGVRGVVAIPAGALAAAPSPSSHTVSGAKP
ncbi:WD40/YVTN/BNR-like repeat-containing protein [Pseudoduganella rivuli]|uniref:WD40/YVTN/BNR-like repeat-containing protein n=1 Tax=Pseudoduganella rivuli TaxID=2666085 RepID=UPI0012AFE4CD|nr:YCF48-related protein [Pseudoduganella rivuli]